MWAARSYGLGSWIGDKGESGLSSCIHLSLLPDCGVNMTDCLAPATMPSPTPPPTESSNKPALSPFLCPLSLPPSSFSPFSSFQFRCFVAAMRKLTSAVLSPAQTRHHPASKASALIMCISQGLVSSEDELSGWTHYKVPRTNWRPPWNSKHLRSQGDTPLEHQLWKSVL